MSTEPDDDRSTVVQQASVGAEQLHQADYEVRKVRVESTMRRITESLLYIRRQSQCLVNLLWQRELVCHATWRDFRQDFQVNQDHLQKDNSSHCALTSLQKGNLDAYLQTGT